jgi:DMSO/TMAO reductase YedYZ molybdopterin-dependent catalytic subunit
MTQPDTGARELGQREHRWRAAGEGALLADGQINREGADQHASGEAGADLAAPAQHDQPPSAGHAQPPSPAVATSVSEARSAPVSEGRPETPAQPVLPPGQYIPRALPVLHYGPVPAFHRQTWDLRIFGATESGAEARLRWDDVEAMPVCQATADFHCVTKFTVPGICWAGIPATEILRRFPPAPAVTHVMIWADFGYSANIRINDFVADDTLLATHRSGERLTPEHGFPLRLVVPHLYAWKSVKWVRAIEYLTADRRGFWEERGYHNTADPWREQRYSYQELEGEGPPL